MLSTPLQVVVADFVIVGGGTAGCILAARLAEHGFETLLISSGSNDTSNPLITQKSEFNNLRFGSLLKHNLATTPSTNLNNRTLDITVFNTLGGCSVNDGGMERMMPNDWNAFVDATGDSSFSCDSMSKYYKMVENFTSTTSTSVSVVHGNDGPIKLNRGHDATFEDVWKKVAKELNETFSEDLAGSVNHGLSFEPTSFIDGLRSWSGDAYVNTAINKYPNLKVMTSATAIKFTLNERTKSIDNVLFLSLDGFFCGVARKEYILSAGVFYSPHLLMLSGIGDPDILKKSQIPVIHELKHVGKNLMDNGAIFIQYGAENLPINQSIPVGLVNTESSITSMDPNIFFVFKMSQITKQLYVLIFNASPKSTFGYISLQNSNPLMPPKITLDYLQDKQDLQVFIDGIDYLRRIMSTNAMKEFSPLNEVLPGPKYIDLAEFVKDTMIPSHHFLGTCCMGCDPQKSVVDNHFKVHGIQNLRIVDGSVFPAGFASKTGPCLTIYALAEKAADILCKEHVCP